MWLDSDCLARKRKRNIMITKKLDDVRYVRTPTHKAATFFSFLLAREGRIVLDCLAPGVIFGSLDSVSLLKKNAIPPNEGVN